MQLLAENLETSKVFESLGWEDFSQNEILQLAAEALIIRVGDLAKKISSVESLNLNSEVWRQAARTRDFVAHHYHRVDKEILYQTVTRSFSELEMELRRISRP